MTNEQKAAYVFAQSVSALAEIEAMKAANSQHPEDQPHGAKDFTAVIEQYGIHHNATCGLFHGD